MIGLELYEMEEDQLEELLLTSTHFNIHYNQQRSYNSVYKELMSVCKGTDIKEVWCVITNVSRAISWKAKCLSIPRHKSTYYNNAQGIGYTKMLRVLDALEKEGYFVFYKGGLCGSDKYTSIYQITDKFREMWKDIKPTKVKDTSSPVVIKDRETKEEKSLRGFTGVSTMAEDMNRYNIQLSSVDLRKGGVVLSNQWYIRSFLDNLHTGGRFYNKTGGIQVLSQIERKKLTINGEDVVELDFKAMHPAILYEWVWQQKQEEVEDFVATGPNKSFDPYNIDISAFISVDSAIIETHKKQYNTEKYNPVRNLVKFAVMSCLNAADAPSAGAGLAKEFYTEVQKWDLVSDKSDFKYYGIVRPSDSNGLKTLKTSYICEACKIANAPIAQFFFADIGVELQYTDSEIMAQVINTLTQEGEAAYSMHDSIIVRSSLADRAEHLMRVAYRNVVGSDRFCFIERK